MTKCNCDCPCHTAPKKHAVYGNIELQNGRVLNWLEFVDGNLSKADAEQEAIKIVSGRWGQATARCWIER